VLHQVPHPPQRRAENLRTDFGAAAAAPKIQFPSSNTHIQSNDVQKSQKMNLSTKTLAQKKENSQNNKYQVNTTSYTNIKEKNK
jgi:hypothetical protein